MALRETGFKAGALHVHTNYSYDVSRHPSYGIEKILSLAVPKQVDFVATTDHDFFPDNYEEVKRKFPYWIPGNEITVFDNSIGHPIHMNALNIPSLEHNAKLSELAKTGNILPFVRYAHENDIVVTANHPWWTSHGNSLNPKAYWRAILDLKKQGNTVPVELNLERSWIENVATFIYAVKHDLPIVSATDSHTGDISSALTLAQGSTISEYLANVQAGNVFIVPRFAGIGYVSSMVQYIDSLILGQQLDTKDFRFGGGAVLDSVIEGIAKSKFHNLTIGKDITRHSINIATAVAGLLYLPVLYTSSAVNVLRSDLPKELMSLRNVSAA